MNKISTLLISLVTWIHFSSTGHSASRHSCSAQPSDALSKQNEIKLWPQISTVPSCYGIGRQQGFHSTQMNGCRGCKYKITITPGMRLEDVRGGDKDLISYDGYKFKFAKYDHVVFGVGTGYDPTLYAELQFWRQTYDYDTEDLLLNYGGDFNLMMFYECWDPALYLPPGHWEYYRPPHKLTWSPNGVNHDIASSGTIYARGTEAVTFYLDTVDDLFNHGVYARVENVTVEDPIDSHGDILFSRDSVPADGRSKVSSWVSDERTYPKALRQWSLSDPNNTLGCSIDANGVITVGKEHGRITVRVSIGECYIEKELEIGACGEGDCEGGDCGQRPGAGTRKVGSVDLSMTLGSGAFGKSMGSVRIHADVPDALLYTPSSLRYSSTGREGVTEVRDAGVLQQILAPQCLMDVLPTGAQSFDVRFYKPGDYGTALQDGRYPITGNPISIWTIENPDAAGASINRVRIREQVADVDAPTVYKSTITEYVHDSVLNGWEMLRDDGLGRGAESIRKERRWSAPGPDGIRVVTHQIRNGANTVRLHQVSEYKTFPWATRSL
jgi:hypothetical protein